MEKYETLYIIQPSIPEEQIEEVIRTFEGIIPENRGTLIKTEKWGRRRLAYRVKNFWEGFYVIHEYEGDGGTQREIERRMRIHDHIVRYLTTRVDPRMAAELERRVEREKRAESNRDEGGDSWGDRGRSDRDDDRRPPRRDREKPPRGDREERS